MVRRDEQRWFADGSAAPAWDEQALGSGIVAGVDEAGIGPWAGPVVAAAVYFRGEVPVGVTDSKRLTASRRDKLFDAIMAAGAVGIGIADVSRIDRDNVLAASHWAMALAVGKLPEPPDLALVDGVYAPPVGCPSRAVVDGDARILSIAAASIIAKVTRDRLMIQAGSMYPGYGFERHKGYGTAEHRQALERLGVCAYHRRTFKPVIAIMERQNSRKPAGVNPLGASGL